MVRKINKNFKIVSAAIMAVLVFITSQISVLAAPAHVKMILEDADAHCYLDINIDLVYAGGWMESSWEMGMSIEGSATSIYRNYTFSNSGEDTYGISAYTVRCEYGFDNAYADYCGWTYGDDRDSLRVYR